MLACVKQVPVLVYLRYLHYLVNLVQHTVQSHRHDGLRRLSRLGYAVFDSLLQQFRIHVPRLTFRTHKHRLRTQLSNRMRTSAERIALHQYLVPRAYATGNQSQMHRRRPRAQTDDPSV